MKLADRVSDCKNKVIASHASHDARRERPQKVTFNRGLFALAFFQAWLFTFYHTTLILHASYSWYNLVYMVSILSAIAFLLLGFWLRYHRPLRRRMLVTASVLGCIAVALIYFLNDSSAEWLYVLGAVAMGASIGIVIPYIGKLFCIMDIESAAMGTFASFFISVFIFFAVSGLPDSAAVLVTAALPLFVAASICLAPRDRTNMREDDSEEVRKILASREMAVFFVGVFLLGLLFGLCMAYCGRTAPELLDGANMWAMLILGILALAYLGITRLFSVRFDFEGFFSPVVPIVIIGLLLFGRADQPSCILLILGYQISDMVIWVVCAWIGLHSGLPQRAFCLMKTCMFAGMLAGTLFEAASGSLGTGDVAETAILTASGIVISVIVLVFRNSHVNNAIRDSAPCEQSALLSEVIRKRCAELGSKYLLTVREEEVLQYLVQGRSLPHIEKKLYISHGTANAHRDHIYAKMGIHSKQELLDVFFEMDDSSSNRSNQSVSTTSVVSHDFDK